MGDVIALRVSDENRRVRVPAMVCLACGVESSASCDCHAPYVPPGKRVEAILAKNWDLTNVVVAGQAGVDEASVRRARKRMIKTPAYSALAEYRTRLADGRPRTVKLKSVTPAKLYKRNLRKGRATKPPVTDKEHLIAFTRELSNFVSDFTIALITWLDREPQMESAGRAALVSTLEAFSMQLQSLAQRVDGR